MAIQETALTGLYIKKETTLGEPIGATPTMVQFPFRSAGLRYSKLSEESALIRASRRLDNVAFVGERVAGPLAGELQPISSGGDNYMAHVIEGVLGSTFSAQTTTTTVSANSVGNKFTGTGIHTAVAVGDYVTVSGFTNAANNGAFLVTAKATGEISVAGTLVTEATVGSVRSRKIIDGTTKNSYAIERQFNAVNKFAYDLGCRFDSFSLDITAEKIIGFSAALQGMTESLGASAGGTRTAALSKSSFSASVNVGTILIAGSAIDAGIKSASLTFNNNVRPQPQVGSRSPRGIALGQFRSNGQINAYFETTTLYDLARADTEFSLVFPMTSPTAPGDAYVIVYPRVKFGDPALEIPGQNDDVTVQLPFFAQDDPVTNAQCIIHAMGQTA